MTKSRILKQTRSFVKNELGKDTSGHDWFHIDRVVRVALNLGKKEKADLYIVELAALLHDIGDWKFNDGDSSVGSKKARALLAKYGAREEDIQHVEFIVEHISYKGGTNNVPMNTIEGKVVQDADRIDALGAIGIARTFAFGGAVGRTMYDPAIKPRTYKSPEEFKKHMKTNTTINHFYEKLLLLADTMNTRSGLALARKRHKFVTLFLKTFLEESDF